MCFTFACVNIQLIRISIRSRETPELVTKSYRLSSYRLFSCCYLRNEFLILSSESGSSQLFRYNGNSHVRLIRPIMLLSRQWVITRQRKNTKKVQQFFIFNSEMVFIFVTICIQICLHYNCFQEIFSEKYLPQFKWKFVWKFCMIICKWSWESRT